MNILAPENPFPEALEDYLKAYTWLIEQDYSADNIIFIGLTAGATLVLAILLALRDNRQPMPLAAIAMSQCHP